MTGGPLYYFYDDNAVSEGSTYVCWEGEEIVDGEVTEPRMIKKFKHAVNDTIPDILPGLVKERIDYSNKFDAILNNAAVNFGVFLDEPSVKCAKNIYMIQQRFDGITLKELEPKFLKKELMYASSVAGTLHQLENEGYVYGDIKAENLLVKTGSVDIMFFDLNSSRSLFQIQSDKRISTNSLCPLNLDLNSKSNMTTIDTYMLGHLLAQRLLKDANQLLLTAIAELEMDIQTFRSHLRTFEDNHFLTNAVARKLLALLKKALAVRSRDRYESAADMKKDLDEIIIETKYQLVAKKPSCIDRAKFLGREAQLKELANLLRQNSLVFISGGGGIGKTELAAQYAATQADQGKTVVQMHYIPGSNDPNDNDPNDDELDRSGIRQLLMNLAIANFPPPPTPPAPGALKAQGNSVSYLQQRKVYYNRKLEILRTLCNEHVLLIIDNFNVESDVGLAELQNTLNGAQCIITTWCDYSKLGYAQLQLENSERDAGWLEQLFRAQCSNPEKPNREVLHEIIQKIEFHTTAIILLGAQMEADWNDENELLRQLKLGLQQVGEAAVGFHMDGVDRTNQRAFGYLQAIFNISSLDQEKRHLLGALSFISSQKFDRDMLLKWIPDVDKVAVNRLVRFRWIEKEDNGEMHLPQVIADVVFDWASGEFASFLDYLHSITVWYANLSDPEQYLNLELFRTVAERFLNCAQKLDIHTSENVLPVAAEVGNLLAKNLDNQFDTLAEMLYRAVQPWYEKLAKEDPMQYKGKLAAVYNGLGVVLSDIGRAEEAEIFYHEALATYRKLAAENPAQYNGDLARVCNNYGNLLNNIGRAEEAEALYREALAIYRKLAAENPAQYNGDLAMSCNNYGILLSDIGRVEEAETLYREALAIYRKLAAENPAQYNGDLAWACNNYGILLSDIGRAEEAETLYHEALAIRRKLAAENPTQYNGDLAWACNNYGILLSDIGRAEEAETLYHEALAIRRKLAAENPTQYNGDLAWVCNNLGNLLRNTDRTKEAETLYRQAQAIYRGLASQNPTRYNGELAWVCNNLGNLLRNTDRTKEAETLYRQAQAIYRGLASQNPTRYNGELASICNSFGILLSDTDRAKEAEALYCEALAIYRGLASQNPAQYNGDLAGICNNLGNLLRNTDRAKEAEDLYREALAIRRELAEANPGVWPDVAMTCNNLAALLRSDSGHMQEAEDLYREALAIRRKLAAENPTRYNGELASTCNSFGILLSDTDREKEAEALYREALVIYRGLAAQNPAQYNGDLAGICNNLGNLLRNTDREKEAESLYREALAIYRGLAVENPTRYNGKLAMICDNLGDLLHNTDQIEEAESLYREALVIYRELATLKPVQYNDNVLLLIISLIPILRDSGRTEEAEKLRHEAVTIIEKVLDSTPAQENAEPADIDTEPSQTNRVGAFFKKLVIALAKLLKKLHM